MSKDRSHEALTSQSPDTEQLTILSSLSNCLQRIRGTAFDAQPPSNAEQIAPGLILVKDESDQVLEEDASAEFNEQQKLASLIIDQTKDAIEPYNDMFVGKIPPLKSKGGALSTAFNSLKKRTPTKAEPALWRYYTREHSYNYSMEMREDNPSRISQVAVNVKGPADGEHLNTTLITYGEQCEIAKLTVVKMHGIEGLKKGSLLKRLVDKQDLGRIEIDLVEGSVICAGRGFFPDHSQYRLIDSKDGRIAPIKNTTRKKQPDLSPEHFKQLTLDILSLIPASQT